MDGQEMSLLKTEEIVINENGLLEVTIRKKENPAWRETVCLSFHIKEPGQVSISAHRAKDIYGEEGLKETDGLVPLSLGPARSHSPSPLLKI